MADHCLPHSWPASVSCASARGLAFLAVAAIASPVAAQGGTGLVLTEPGSVRAASLQGAGAAMMGDAGSVFTNPAGLATIAHIALEGSYTRLTTQNTLLTGAMGWRLSQFDFGAGIKYLDHGPGGNYEALGVGSLIYRFGLIAMGGSAKVLRQETATGRTQGVSGDLGLAIAVFDIMALGFSVQNVHGNWNPNSPLAMPRVTRLGFTMNYVDPQESFRLLSTIESQWTDGLGGRLVLGLEGGLVLGHAIGVLGRVAYGGRYDGAMTSHFTWGVTAELGWVDVDYALEPTDALGERGQRLGVRLTL